MTKFASIAATSAAAAAFALSLATAASAAPYDAENAYVAQFSSAGANVGLRGATVKQPAAVQDYSGVYSGRSSSRDDSSFFNRAR